MKILAIYLPAYHREKYNDLAWGEGFTEWDNVRSGKKLYSGHYQPIVPLNQNYYDLSKKENIEEQAATALNYGVDGFIFYHYWFGDGKTALTTPAKLFRDEVKTNLEYCLCWANHTWANTWHGRPTEVIVNQEYGDKSEWIKHINYLMPFFKDDRYIKKNNRPMLYIYNMSEIKCFDMMLEVWNEELKKNGFDGLYIVEYISSKNRNVANNNTNAVVEFEPLYTTFFDISKIRLFDRWIDKKKKQLDFQSYDYLWKKIIRRKRKYKNCIIQKGCFVRWDNSARKGLDAMIVKGATPKKFGYYLKKLVLSKRKNTDDCIVINAWNEWSEGAYLEPDEVDKFSYLEEIKKIKEM